ncbi:UNVERIFIED_CONTAM: hypothetical protein FKN15_065713 [Acipenser sinensis]
MANNSNSQKLGEEKKKKTQYAEAMALGYLCDTISPFIFAFFCFGYLPSFFVGMWQSRALPVEILAGKGLNSSLPGKHLFSSYYGYLQKDVYHTTKICLHNTYWLVMSWEEFVLSVLIDKEGAVEEVYRCAFVNVVLLLLTLVMEVIVVCFLLSTLGRLHYQLEIAMLAIFSLICLYGTLASLANSIFTKELLPLGPPLLKATQEKADKTPPPPPCSIATSRKTSGLLSISKLLDASGVCGIPTDTVYALAASCKHPQAIEKIYNIKATQEKADKTPPPPPCSIATSRKTSGLLSISKLLDAGGVCGVPTDTVYALAASCKHPQAIEKIYNIKDRPQEKPICICISNLEQLSTAKPPFSPLLWEFMRNVYPGGISCIVKKGEWLNKLGVGPAYDRVGTKESIMIRVPDHTVTVHLCNMTGATGHYFSQSKLRG